MGSQLPALEQLFDEWSKKHAEKLSTAAPYEMPEQEEPYGGFVRDGIVNLESWKKQKVRICFILNEAGGRLDMEHYPEGHDLAAEWNEKGSFSKFMFKLSVWTKAIQDAFGQPTTYKKADVVKIRDDLIRSIAIINIKKSDGNRRTDFALLQRFAWEDAEELRRELELVNPNIIICGENLKFLREPFVPKPPKKKEGEEGTDTAVATAESSDATVAPAEVEAKVEIAETESVVIPAETETATETEDETETTSKKHKRNVDSTESALVAAFKPPILPPYKEDGRRNYVFLSSELKQISKFTYLWGNKLVFSMWTPANFMGTISSNTINYYAVREVVRAALKAFGEKQKRQKIQQMNEQKHQEKLQRKLEAQQKKAAQAQAQGENPAQPQPKAETPQATAPAETPAKVETAAEVKPQPKVETPAPAETPAEVKPKKATKTKTAATAETPAAETPAEAKPKKTTRTKTKAATASDATAETPAPKTRTRKTAAKPKEE